MAYRITVEEYGAICEAERKTKDKRISKRLRVLQLRYEGMPNPEIAKKIDLSSGRVSYLISEFNQKGPEEYIRMKYGGNHRNMTYEKEQEILNRFIEAAEKGQVITVREIKAPFDEKLGRDTGRGYMALRA